jgi:hypothetical protein
MTRSPSLVSPFNRHKDLEFAYACCRIVLLNGNISSVRAVSEYPLAERAGSERVTWLTNERRHE